MKIHFVGSHLGGGGAERVMITLANTFAKKGYDVTIITFIPIELYQPEQKVARIRLHDSKIKNHTIRAFASLKVLYSDKAVRPDLMISFLPDINLISILIARLYRLKIIVSEHINHLSVDSKKTIFARKFLYRFANKVTVLTKFDVPYFEKYGAKVKIVPNPSTFKKFIPKENHTRKNVILCLGHLDRYHQKGFDNFVPILEKVLKRNPTWSVKFIGRGEIGKGLIEKLANDFGIENQVFVTGHIDNVDELMQESSIYALPSRFEGLPMVLIEAMSQGLACIAYDCISGPSELIKDGHDGLLIANQNGKEMEKGLLRLINDINLRKKIGHNAINIVDKYSVSSTYLLWNEMFLELNLK